MPSSPLRRNLRAAGHHLNAIVQVGKEGVTDAVLRQLSEALDHHELVKLRVGTESPEDRFEVAEALAARGDAHIAQIIGRTVLVYRKHPEKPRFEPGPEQKPEPTAASRGTPPRPAPKRPAPRPAAKRPASRRPAPKRPAPRRGPSKRA